MAIRCVEHAQTYWHILEAVKTVHLTKYDDELYDAFLEAFPEFKPLAEGENQANDPVRKIMEVQVKHPDAQPRWQALASKFENKSALSPFLQQRFLFCFVFVSLLHC